MGWSSFTKKFNTHASGTLDPPEVRNARIHMVALVASMSALAMGYDTAVIGGTMALDSFRRDFQLDGVEKTVRDTIQGNIVSTFQVSDGVHETSISTIANRTRLAASSAPCAPFRSLKSMVAS